MDEYLYGRELLFEELPLSLQQTIKIDKGHQVAQTASYDEKAGRKYCKRCQHEFVKVDKNACICGNPCGYCRNCLKMGKVRLCSKFYSLAEPNYFKRDAKYLFAWEGTLSTQQTEASKQIVQSIKNVETRLLWAVTGAGKTEMLFEGIYDALNHKKRVCIASPRIDVCLELAPRLRRAFPQTAISLLYGGMEEPYKYTQLVIATTHQLFRFKEAFDVLIIDEIDAFPFHSDRSLHFAANKAKKKKASVIYLSATPSRAMQKQVQKNQLLATILPARYHGHPLPEPKMKWCANWKKSVLQSFLKTSLGKKVAECVRLEKRFLIFVPNIEWMLRLEKVLRKIFKEVPFEAVSAEDSNRKSKVMQMRNEEIQFLITSTILERGITFQNIDVFVIGAEDRVFSEAALVQIAGRCGRTPDFPTGEVIFFHDGKSLAMKRAVKQIKRMNVLAKKRGLVH